MTDSEFFRRLADWQPFYATVATVAATLTGLLFVALSINRERLGVDDARTFRRLARRTFGDFLFVLAVAMVMLVPKQDARSLAIVLLGLAILRLFRLARQSRDPAYRHIGRPRMSHVVREHALPVGSCLALAAIAGPCGSAMTRRSTCSCSSCSS